MNKSVCLILSISGLSKIVLYEILYDYVNPQYVKKGKLCYRFTVYKKIKYIYVDINKDFQARFDTFELDRPSPKEKIK